MLSCMPLAPGGNHGNTALVNYGFKPVYPPGKSNDKAHHKKREIVAGWLFGGWIARFTVRCFTTNDSQAVSENNSISIAGIVVAERSWCGNRLISFCQRSSSPACLIGRLAEWPGRRHLKQGASALPVALNRS
jgi:hypothetical protein